MWLFLGNTRNTRVWINDINWKTRKNGMSYNKNKWKKIKIEK